VSGGDGLVAGGAPLDPQVEQLPEGLDPRAGVLPIRDLGAQSGLHLLGLAIAAVDLARELPLLSRQRVQTGVDDDLLALGALADGRYYSALLAREPIVDISLTRF
jgi:hypothetical protein